MIQQPVDDTWVRWGIGVVLTGMLAGVVWERGRAPDRGRSPTAIAVALAILAVTCPAWWLQFGRFVRMVEPSPW